jgi:hypothetical protein
MFFHLIFVLVLKTSVLSLMHPSPTRTRDKTAVFRTRKKTGEKKFFFFSNKQLVKSYNKITLRIQNHSRAKSSCMGVAEKEGLLFVRFQRS